MKRFKSQPSSFNAQGEKKEVMKLIIAKSDLWIPTLIYVFQFSILSWEG